MPQDNFQEYESPGCGDRKAPEGDERALAGRLVMAGLSGPELDGTISRLIREYGLSAFILFRRNISGRQQVEGLCSRLRAVCTDSAGREALIAVDQEGGRVRRLLPPEFPDIPSNEQVGRQDSPIDAARQQAESAGRLLRGIGIDVNFAPVLDLALEASSYAAGGVLSQRCYSSSPHEAARIGAAYIEALQQEGVAAVAKHFPGIGRVQADPHEDRPVVLADEDTIVQEALPFRAAVEAGVLGMMTSHVVYQGLDPAGPATYSKIIAQGLLRDRFGFSGVLFSDDMEMGGIIGRDAIGEACIRAIGCGHDMVLVCSRYDLLEEVLSAVSNAISAGILPMSRVLEAAGRINGLISSLRP